MPSLPAWIEIQTNRNSVDTPEHRQIVALMTEETRPFFSIEQLQAQLDIDPSEQALRNQLRELQTAGIVASESVSESVTVYYINHTGIIRQLMSEGESAFWADTPLDHLSTRGFLTMQDTAGIRTLVLGGFQLTLVLLTLGIVLTIAGIDLSTSSDFILWGTAFDLFTVCLLLLLTERAIRWIRPQNTGSNKSH